MACERYEGALKQLAAGAAPTFEPPRLGAPRVESELESHLAACARCREELDELRRALALVDSELLQVVGAEPSADLAARIRRAAAEDPVEPARPAWLWPTLAAAAVILLAVAILMKRSPAEPPVAALENRSQGAARAVSTPPPSPSSGGTLPAPGPAPVATSRPVAADRARSGERRDFESPEPEVLVPPGQVEALQRLAALATRRHVESPSLAAVEQGSPDLVPPRPIDVRSVEITPLEIVPSEAAEDSGT